MSKDKSSASSAANTSIFEAIESMRVSAIGLAIFKANASTLGNQTTAPFSFTEVTGLTEFGAICALIKALDKEKQPDEFQRLKICAKSLLDKMTPEQLALKDVNGDDAFMWAMRTGVLELVSSDKYTLDPVKVNQAFHEAVNSLNTEGVKAVLKIPGVDPGALDKPDGSTALSRMAGYVWNEKAKARAADVTAGNKLMKQLPLMAKVVALILESANFSAQGEDERGSLPCVQSACEFPNYQELLKALKSKGANFDALDRSGRSTLDWYADFAADGVVSALLEGGASPNVQELSSGRTPVHALLLNPSKINFGGPGTLEVLNLLLSSEIKPPFNPHLKMKCSDGAELTAKELAVFLLAAHRMHEEAYCTGSSKTDCFFQCVEVLGTYETWYNSQDHH